MLVAAAGGAGGLLLVVARAALVLRCRMRRSKDAESQKYNMVRAA